jgi:hypothetical protein
VRSRGAKLLIGALLLKDGSGCRLTLVFGLLMMLSNEGIGARVGRLSTAAGSAELAEALFEEKIEAGLGAWDSSAHPTRKDSTLTMVNHIRKANFKGFMNNSFLEAAAALQ